MNLKKNSFIIIIYNKKMTDLFDNYMNSRDIIFLTDYLREKITKFFLVCSFFFL